MKTERVSPNFASQGSTDNQFSGSAIIGIMIGFAKEQRPFVFKGKHAMKYYEKNWQLK